ncbi:MAG: hypothetical protein Q8900_08860 [Bacillota bacterium]|nr:hypothetical protein [Bacillota bacterium]
MKFKKKTTMIISLALGATLFATTALAEVNTKDGYEQLKDTLKYTAESFSSRLNNYTITQYIEIKDNENVIYSQNLVQKYDIKNGVCEHSGDDFDQVNGNTQSYYYKDKNCDISYDSYQQIYNENDYAKPDNTPVYTNPFKDDTTIDIEKIADAAVGNLKDSLVVEQKTDGNKEISGSFSEAQIPSIINAFASYAVKRSTTTYSNTASNGNTVEINNVETSLISKDIFIKNVNGKMETDKNGLIKDASGTGTISGKDKDNKEHNLTFKLSVKIIDVNSTVVKKPDLTEKKVQKNDVGKSGRINTIISNIGKYIGQYKSDIVMDKDGKFQKIGEKIIDITSIDNKNIEGTYHEEYKKGYEQYKTNYIDSKFIGQIDENGSAKIDILDTEGNKHSGRISILTDQNGRIYFNMDKDEYPKDVVSIGAFDKIFK